MHSVKPLSTYPTEFLALIDRLNQELDQTEQEATEGLNLARQNLSRFPDNSIIVQFFAFFNNIVLFIDNSRQRIQNIVARLSTANVTAEETQETGENLATLLGRVLEAKIAVSRVIARLENFS